MRHALDVGPGFRIPELSARDMRNSSSCSRERISAVALRTSSASSRLRSTMRFWLARSVSMIVARARNSTVSTWFSVRKSVALRCRAS